MQEVGDRLLHQLFENISPGREDTRHTSAAVGNDCPRWKMKGGCPSQEGAAAPGLLSCCIDITIPIGSVVGVHASANPGRPWHRPARSQAVCSPRREQNPWTGAVFCSALQIKQIWDVLHNCQFERCFQRPSPQSRLKAVHAAMPQ